VKSFQTSVPLFCVDTIVEHSVIYVKEVPCNWPKVIKLARHTGGQPGDYLLRRVAGLRRLHLVPAKKQHKTSQRGFKQDFMGGHVLIFMGCRKVGGTHWTGCPGSRMLSISTTTRISFRSSTCPFSFSGVSVMASSSSGFSTVNTQRDIS